LKFYLGLTQRERERERERRRGWKRRVKRKWVRRGGDPVLEGEHVHY